MIAIFVDTNVLVYVRDSGKAEKKIRAEDWLGELWLHDAGRISTQALIEYYAVVTRKLARSLTLEKAREDVRLLQEWNPLHPDPALFERAWQAHDAYSLSWWDALIVAAADKQH
jgi:predicted nucleic acid-binding protein